MKLSSKIKVAVLRGGASESYNASLKTGEHVLSTLREMPDSYEPIDIFISKDGEWHREGLVYEPHRALEYADVVWNALHGVYGEDGQVERLLEGLKIPFTGSGAAASAFAMNKEMAKRLYREHALLTPTHELVTEESFNEDQLVAISRNHLYPMIVKPANATGSLGVSLAHTFPELKQAIKETFVHSPRVLVEEFIKGDEVSCGVIEEAKGESLYALLPTRPDSMKRSGRLSVEENKSVEEMAKRAHRALGLRHYSASDFIITPKRNIYILETNSLPRLHRGSILYQSLDATGWHHHDFVEHVLKLTL